MANVFISYSRKDKEAARKLAEALKDQELDFWIDWEGIEPTVDWWQGIENAVKRYGRLTRRRREKSSQRLIGAL